MQKANVTYDGCMLKGIKRKCGKPVTPNPLAPMNDTNNDEIPDAWQIRGIRNSHQLLYYLYFYTIFIIGIYFGFLSTLLLFSDSPREFSFGFCFGVLCLSVIFIFIAIILLILDHFNPQPPKEEKAEES